MFCAGDFLLNDSPRLGRPNENISWPITNIMQRRVKQHTQNIKINQ